MTARLDALTFSTPDPLTLADFWSGLFGWERGDPGSADLVPFDDTGFRLRFVRSQAPKLGQNHMHFDLTSESLDHQQETVARALALGARHIDVGQLPEEGHVVLADPDGNEFCVLGPGNAFLADCGFVGALECDGSQRVGHFWSAALGWSLVWDQDEETAIRSPHGGPKVAWGGPPVAPRIGLDRLHFDLAPVESDQAAEVARLEALGARRCGEPGCRPGSVLMTDPDGREFCLLGHTA